MSREVADAFISVHGDLAPFRKDLEKANGTMKDWADEQAQSFTDAWGDRMNKDLTKKWSSIVDALHSGKKVDFSRMIENFDGSDLDAASEKIHQFMDTLLEAEKISEANHRKTVQAIDAEIKARQRQQFIEADLARDREMWDRANKIMMAQLADARDRDKAQMAEAIAMNEKYDRSFTGMVKNIRRSDLEGDFKKIAAAMAGTDFASYAKGFENFDEFRDRIDAVSTAMLEQNRITTSQAEEVRRAADAYVTAEKDKARALADTKAATAAAKVEQDRYNKSLEGMLRAAKLRQIESDYRSLTSAMANGDWSPIAKGARNIEDMRYSVRMAVADMQSLGRITSAESARIGAAFEHAAENTDKFRISFKEAAKDVGRDSDSGGFRKFHTMLRSLGSASQGLREHLGAFAGLNVFGDMIESGLDFIHNLDRIALSASTATLKLGTMAAVGGSGLASAVTIVKDLADALAGTSILLPAFATGAGIVIGVAVAAFKDLKTELKDLGPLFTKLQDSISAKFWKEAKAPIEEMVRGLMPTLNEQLGITATRLGSLTGEFAKAFKDNATPERVTVMMERLNAALDRGKAAVAPLVRAFVNLGETGTKYFGRAADAIVGMSEDFDRFIQRSKDNGDLDRWIERGIKGFKDVGRSIDGVFGIFNAFNSAAEKAGFGGLASFADKLQGAAATMQSAGFQKGLVDILSGMADAVSKVGTALYDLGPAVASITPFIKNAFSDIGTAAAILIGYIGEVIADPAIHVSMLNFTDAMITALEKLEPAIAPFTSSLAHAVDLLALILPNIAEVVSAFAVNLMPVLDKMSDSLGTLITPLKDLTIQVIEKLTPSFKNLDEKVVTPLINGVRDNLIPAFSEAVDKLAPLVDSIVTALAPVITELATNILPGIVKLAGGLAPYVETIVKFATPFIKTFFEELGKAIKGMADWMDDFNTNAGPFLKHLQEIADKVSTIKFEPPKTESGKENPWLALATKWAVALVTESPTAAAFAKYFKGTTDSLLNGWNTVVKTAETLVDPKKLTAAIAGGLGGIVNAFASIDAPGGLNETVNKWFDDTFFKPIRDAWDAFFRGLDGWWKDIKAGFQGWMKDTFNLGTIFGGKEAKITNGGGLGGGGASRGVGATILPQMLDQEAEGSFLDMFIAGIQEKAAQMWTSITEALTNFGTDVMTNWNAFWDGVGTKVQEIWDGVVVWVQTKAAEISANVGQFITDVGTNWNAFWDGVNQKVTDIWVAVTTWVQTKAEEIRAGIAAWATDVANTWNGFWDGVNQKVTEIWTTVTSWIQTKRDEIKSGIDGFVTDVKNNWNSFWDGVNRKVTDVWNAVTGWISGKTSEIRGTIDRFVGDVRTNWDNFWNGAKDTVTRAWTGIKDGISTGSANAEQFVRELPGKIVSALGDLRGLLVNAGNSIMNGFKSGLEGAWGGVKDFVGGIAGWIAEHKGPISYDKVLLVPAGQAIMAGLRSGLDDGVAPLTNQLQNITALLSDTLTEGFARSKMYIAGADAALGLADGIKANAAAVQAAMGDIVTDPSATLTVAGGVGGATPGATILNVAEGAVQVVTPTEDPQLVANKTIDGLITVASNL